MADKILIVDDDPAIRKLLEKVMRSNEMETTAADSGTAALRLLASNTYDLILMDIMLGDMEGFEVIKRLRSQGIKTPVMIVSGRNEDYDSLYGLSIGADDYIRKPFSVIELITRVKALLRRTEGESLGTVMCVGNIVMDNDRHIVHVDGRLAELTFKEYELLKFLMSNVGIVMTRDAIMRKVWGTDFGGGTRTVDMHIKTLRQKLKNSGSHIRTLRNVGYVME